MLIEHLDRTQWSLKQAIDHVAAQILRATPPSPDAEAVAKSLPPAAPRWMHPSDPAVIARSEASRELQIALRDGDLHAQGRLSTTRSPPWSQNSLPFDLHSGHYSSISPEQWRAGQANTDFATLTMADGQFIEIRTPRFVVMAIWPATPEPTVEAAIDPETDATYTTPYLDLLARAIAANGINDRYQCKKEVLSDWFRSQTVEGEPVSQNLADAMATLIRLPSSQRGGAKRIF